MLYQNQSSLLAQRKGVILLVVISLLTLFAIVGISFVLYANAEANASKIFRDAAAQTQPDMDPELLLNYFLGQLIYDVNDDATGVYSAMRGASLGRGMYGYYYPTASSPIIVPNVVPYNGVGRLHTAAATKTTPATFMNPFNLDDYQLPNYTYFAVDGFLRDPERWQAGGRANLSTPVGSYTGGSNVPYTYPDLNNMFLAAVKADGTVLMPSFHRHWLFNDQASPPGPGPAGPAKTFNDPRNANWGDPRFLASNIPPYPPYPTNPAPAPPLPTTDPNYPFQAKGKYFLLRPRPVDQLLPGENFPPNRPYFDYPEDPGGDVKNLPGPGYLDPVSGSYVNNDSIWMDLGAPVMVAPDGTKFKALFAPLIIDLDGRINLNTAGNVRGWTANNTNQAHVSNQGWGPWEVNLGYVLNQGGTEWTSLFLGNGSLRGRYGPDMQPSQSGTSAPSGSAPHYYARVDFDGCDETNNYGPTGQITLPQATPNAFPNYPSGYSDGSPAEMKNHPLDYNYFQPGGDDHVFPISNMEALLRYGDTNSPALTSDLFRLCPSNSQNSRVRNLLTTLSFDADVAGLAPWINTYSGAGAYQANPNPAQAPYGPAIPFPSLTSRQAGTTNNPEFGLYDWRGFNATNTMVGNLNAVLSKVNLNRYLTPYPSYTDPTHPQLVNPAGRYDDMTQGPQIQTQFQQAQGDRQALAGDIYNVFLQVTGVTVPNTVTGPQDPALVPLRWLAQLAVNIVDYIDEDDISTPFNFFPNGTYSNGLGTYPTAWNAQQLPGYWVFGTELPHVVLNEVLAEYKPQTPKPGSTFNMNFWIELYNPFQNVPATANQPTDGQPVQLNMQLQPGGVSASNATNANNPYPPYQVVIATGVPPNQVSPPSSAQNDNVLGEINMSTPSYRTQTAIATDNPPPPNNPPDFEGGSTTLVTGGPPMSPTIPPGGFFLLVPQGQADPYGGPIAGSGAQPNTEWLKCNDMQYTCTITTVDTMVTPNKVTGWNPQPPTGVGTPPTPPKPTDSPSTNYVVLLRRLANPHIPYQPNPTAGIWYNPYVTVDYQENVQAKDMTQTGAQSSGKIQPYAAYQGAMLTEVVLQGAAGPKTGTTSHTFGQINKGGNNQPPAPYDWLVHLDRQLISPMELLQVSGYQPWQLTHQFVNPALTGGALPLNPKFQHRVPWLDEDNPGSGGNSHRLYRAFEFLETGNRAAGMTPGGRIPGKVNINTIWDPEIFLALADPQQGNSNAFDYNALYNTNPTTPGIWQNLLSLRSTQIAAGPPPQFAPGQNDRPFWSLAAGTYSNTDQQFKTYDTMGNQIAFGPNNNTLLRTLTVNGAANSQRLLQVFNVGSGAVNHPYLQNQLLTKLFNNVTTRSNVFAVFVTVGFFQVIDDTSRPVKLGAEIGRAENRHIRHRMFAIVDRTNLATDPNNPGTIQPPPVYINGSTAVPPPPPNPPLPPIAISGGQFPTNPTPPPGGPLPFLTGTYEGITWNIQSSLGGFNFGTNVLIDTGPNQELVNVASINAGNNPSLLPPTISVKGATKRHSGNIAVTPVNTFIATSVTGNITTTTAPPVQIQIVAQSTALQGAPSNPQVGTNLVISDFQAGNKPEVVQIVQPPPGQSGIWILPWNTSTGTPQAFQSNHQTPFTLSYPISVGGNPGPQANFDMRQVPWVVRYFSITN